MLAHAHAHAQVRLSKDEETGAGVLIVQGPAAQLERAHAIIKMVVSSEESDPDVRALLQVPSARVRVGVRVRVTGA